MNLKSLFIAVLVVLVIFVLRAAFFKLVLRYPLSPLLFFAPRGLITILLYLSIPATMVIDCINVGVVTQVIFITILMMSLGTMMFDKTKGRMDTDNTVAKVDMKTNGDAQNNT